MPIEHGPAAPPLVPSFCLEARALLQDIFVGAAEAPEFSQAFVFEIDMVHGSIDKPIVAARLKTMLGTGNRMELSTLGTPDDAFGIRTPSRPSAA
jgi:hypothetical protein